jgi:hypothetical protein
VTRFCSELDRYRQPLARELIDTAFTERIVGTGTRPDPLATEVSGTAYLTGERSSRSTGPTNWERDSYCDE